MLNAEQCQVIADFTRKWGAHKVDAKGEVQVPDRYFRARWGESLGKGKGELAGVYVGEYETPEALAAAVTEHVRQTIIAGDEPSKVWLTVFERGDRSCTDFVFLEVQGGRTVQQDAMTQIRDAAREAHRPLEAAVAVMGVEVLHTFKDHNQAIMNQNERLFSAGLDLGHELVEVKVRNRLLEEENAYLKAGGDRAHKMAMMDRAMPLLENWLPQATDALSSVLVGHLARGHNADTPCPADPGEAADWHIANAVRGVVGLFAHVQAHPGVLVGERKERLDKLIEKALGFVVNA